MSSDPGNSPSSRPSLWSNWISVAGLVVAVGAFLAFLLLAVFDQASGGANPYVGIFSYMVAPGFLFLGLLLILAGAWWTRMQSTGSSAPPRLSIDLGRPRDRMVLLWFGGGAAIYLLLTVLGSFQAYHVAESNAFCGASCHPVMKPEQVTYEHSPHANVPCVDCHVGEGAEAFVMAKMNGSRQLLEFVSDSYNRPVPAPVHNLRSAYETCTHCHRTDKATGDVYLDRRHFLSDEDNTPYTMRMLVHVGDENQGIHWHMNPAHKVEFFAEDEQRQKIPWVRVTDEKGTVKVFRTEAYEGEPPPGEIRSMDCTDCHNRPGHEYATANDAVEQAMREGLIDLTWANAKGTIVDLLTASYATEGEALTKIKEGLRKAYQERPAPKPPEVAEADGAGGGGGEGEVVPAAVEPAAPPAPAPSIDAMEATVVDIFQRNFFPEMKADFRAYPDNKGHKDSAGCMRCHDREHKAEGDVKMAASDCKTCHTIVAQGNDEELATASLDGLKFEHPNGPSGKGLCNDCHNGMTQEEEADEEGEE